MVIEMPYNKNLSSNSYKIVGRGGRRTNCTKPDVKLWMELLADKIREEEDFYLFYGLPVKVKVDGYFLDNRRPDIHNLHKVIADAVEPALGINDKYIQCVDGEAFPDCERQRLVIEISLL